jgi:hypothetical protein
MEENSKYTEKRKCFIQNKKLLPKKKSARYGALCYPDTTSYIWHLHMPATGLQADGWICALIFYI